MEVFSPLNNVPSISGLHNQSKLLRSLLVKVVCMPSFYLNGDFGGKVGFGLL
jgi:hypothetical protein